MIVTDLDEIHKPNEDATIDESVEIIKELEKHLSISGSGVGLAANQIGIKKNIAIVRYGKYKIDLINPVVVETYGCFENKGEGCLSMPGKSFNTIRFKEMFIKCLNHPDGLIVTNDVSVVCGHEIDHCNSITMDQVVWKEPGRNDTCLCSSGKKYKKCCLNYRA